MHLKHFFINKNFFFFLKILSFFKNCLILFNLIIIFFPVISSYWKMFQKFYSSFFFLQYTPNKFMKIYFLHFSLTLHTVKLLEKYFFSSYNFFSHFQPPENTKNLYTYFFFHFPEYSNKFIKIYFHSFFFNFTP